MPGTLFYTALKTESTALICQHLLQSRVLGKGIVVLGLSAAAMALAARLASRARVSGLCSEVDSLKKGVSEIACHWL